MQEATCSLLHRSAWLAPLDPANPNSLRKSAILFQVSKEHIAEDFAMQQSGSFLMVANLSLCADIALISMDMYNDASRLIDSNFDGMSFFWCQNPCWKR